MLKSHAKLTNNGYIAYQTCVWAMRLAMIAPDIIHRILEGDIPRNLSLERLRVPIPDLWEEQRRMLLENQ